MQIESHLLAIAKLEQMQKQQELERMQEAARLRKEEILAKLVRAEEDYARAMAGDTHEWNESAAFPAAEVEPKKNAPLAGSVLPQTPPANNNRVTLADLESISANKQAIANKVDPNLPCVDGCPGVFVAHAKVCSATKARNFKAAQKHHRTDIYGALTKKVKNHT
jgi:hypothetical protein